MKHDEAHRQNKLRRWHQLWREVGVFCKFLNLPEGGVLDIVLTRHLQQLPMILGSLATYEGVKMSRFLEVRMITCSIIFPNKWLSFIQNGL